MQKFTTIACALSTLFFYCPWALAEQTLISVKTSTPPHIDGIADDDAWKRAKKITTHDKVANIDVTLKSVHTTSTIYLLVQFPDPTECKIHKPWIWDSKQHMYLMGPQREDCFVFKWGLADYITDLSLSTETPYEADIWFWKAHRTNPAGYADDKTHNLSRQKNRKSKPINISPGKVMYLSRRADYGNAAYQATLQIDHTKDLLPQFHPRQPSKSRADIRAKGVWKDGIWTVEFKRQLKTGTTDDVQFDQDKAYLFGVSRYEIAGRAPNPELSQPFYGSGDVSEKLFLVFEQ